MQIELAFFLPLFFLLSQLSPSLLDRKSGNLLHQSSNPPFQYPNFFAGPYTGRGILQSIQGIQTIVTCLLVIGAYLFEFWTQALNRPFMLIQPIYPLKQWASQCGQTTKCRQISGFWCGVTIPALLYNLYFYAHSSPTKEESMGQVLYWWAQSTD